MKIVCALDMSGSIGFFSYGTFKEMAQHADLSYFDLTVIRFDHAIQAITKVESMEDIENMKHCSRGGTCFEPVFDYVNEMDEKPEYLAMFTDGYAPMPDKPDYEVIWIMPEGCEGNQCIMPPYGTRFMIP